MSYYQNLREHLKALEDNGKLRKVTRVINKDTQLVPLARLQYRGLPQEQRTAFLFENVTDSLGRKYDTPVLLGALAGSRDIFALGMQCQAEEIMYRLAEAERNPIAPVEISSAPVQEEIYIGDDLEKIGGLGRFPIPIFTPGFDPAPYITAPYWVTKDPDSGIHNIGMYRAMLKAPLRTGINFAHARRGGAIHLQKYRKRGKPMPAILVIGGPPNLGYAAVSQLPTDVDEFGVAGGIAGTSLETVRGKTVDLPVPAHAEIVFEGEVTTDELEPEAPFGEAYGFVGLRDMNPFFTVKCITCRRNPIWLATISQYPPTESSIIRHYANSGTLYKHLYHSLGFTEVLGVSYVEEVGSRPIAVIQIGEVTHSTSWDILEEAAKRMPTTKLFIGVNKDVNHHDIDSVMLAIMMRS
ncbi:UbiD family decarboxylase, partial [Chloroflexota bacterium]